MLCVFFHCYFKKVTHQPFFCIRLILRESLNEFSKVLICRPVLLEVFEVSVLDETAHWHVACKESMLAGFVVNDFVPGKIGSPPGPNKGKYQVDMRDNHLLL